MIPLAWVTWFCIGAAVALTVEHRGERSPAAVPAWLALGLAALAAQWFGERSWVLGGIAAVVSALGALMALGKLNNPNQT
ncbi:MAG: hypothetical protein JWO67_1328 [Streptosporangiaceae bacterium]|nr:hypothetical protein [Streptosporangiaceae bacterium]